jgi:hypothetical protein
VLVGAGHTLPLLVRHCASATRSACSNRLMKRQLRAAALALIGVRVVD